MKSLLCYALPIMLCLMLSACSTSTEKGSESKDLRQAYLHQEIGMGYLKAEKYPEALQQLLLADKLAPNNPNVLNNLAIAYQFRGRSDKAVEYFQRSLKLDSKLTDARSNLAQVYIETGKYSQALEQLLISREDLTYPIPEKIHANLGIVYFHLSDHKNAKKELDLALKANRNYCLAKFYKVKNQYALKNYLVSSNLADKNIYACPKLSQDESYYFSGMSYYMNSNFEKAQDRFSRLIEKFPTSEFTKKAYTALAAIKVKKNERNR